MIPPPELDPERARRDWWARILSTRDPKQPQQEHWDRVIRLGPGDTTTAFWSGYPPQQNEADVQRIRRGARLVNFYPGDYTIKVIGFYWDNAEAAGKQTLDSRSETVQKRVAMVAPQLVILVGASLGGAATYVALPSIRRLTTPELLATFAGLRPSRALVPPP